WKLVVKGSPQRSKATIVPVPKPEKDKTKEADPQAAGGDTPPTADPTSQADAAASEESPEAEATQPDNIEPEQAAPEATKPTLPDPNNPPAEQAKSPAKGEEDAGTSTMENDQP